MKESNLMNIVIIIFLDIDESKISQILIDKCLFRKYTYSSLKHI